MEQIIKKNFYIVFCFIAIFIFSCDSSWEKQIDYLLPKQNKLSLIETKEHPMASLNTYKVNDNIVLDSISSYPIEREVGERWVLKKWRITQNKEEIKNLIEMLKEVKCNTNCDDIDVYFNKELDRVINGIENHKGYISYYFNTPYDKKPNNYYYSLDFIEFYYLNIKDSQLFHISYGKF